VGIYIQVTILSYQYHRDFYVPDLQNIYLSYSVNLLIDLSKSSFDYDSFIFAEPLPNARFDENYEEFDMNKLTISSMNPLFANTLDKHITIEVMLTYVLRHKYCFTNYNKATAGSWLCEGYSNNIALYTNSNTRQI
jgi:hypothetical protein